MMMSVGYNDPGFGLPGTGGSFIGTGRAYAPCCIPPDIQPAIPPAGLFGPDTPLHGWGFPGFKPASDITAPQLPHILPATRPIEGPFGAGGGNLPGTHPSPNMPGFGLTVYSGAELTAGIIRRVNGALFGYMAAHPSPFHLVPKRPAQSTSDSSPIPAEGYSERETAIRAAYANGDIVIDSNGQLSYSTKGENRARAEQSGIRRKHQEQAKINAGLSAEEKERQSQERAANNTIYEYYEGVWQEVPKGIDRAKYFDDQRKAAIRERNQVVIDFVVDAIQYSILGVGLLRAGISLAEQLGSMWAANYMKAVGRKFMTVTRIYMDGRFSPTLRVLQIKGFIRVEMHNYGKGWGMRPHIHFEFLGKKLAKIHHTLEPYIACYLFRHRRSKNG